MRGFVDVRRPLARLAHLSVADLSAQRQLSCCLRLDTDLDGPSCQSRVRTTLGAAVVHSASNWKHPAPAPAPVPASG